jgi:hypothetical protein
MFSAIGVEAFVERARRELLATGEKVRKRGVASQNELTPQEEHIARLARAGAPTRDRRGVVPQCPRHEQGLAAKLALIAGIGRLT